MSEEIKELTAQIANLAKQVSELTAHVKRLEQLVGAKSIIINDKNIPAIDYWSCK